MDPTKDLTPAQEREARRRLRRVVGEGTPEEQARRVFDQALRQAAKRRTRAAVRTLVSGIGQVILDVLRQGRKP